MFVLLYFRPAASPLPAVSDYTGTPCASSDLVRYITVIPSASDEAQDMPGFKSLLLQLLNINYAGECYFVCVVFE